jgi:hypothetical protein
LSSKKTGVLFTDEGYGLFYPQPSSHPNPRRFYGAVCKNHPSLRGERRRLDGECIGCHDQQPVEKEEN